jgi:serralysin
MSSTVSAAATSSGGGNDYLEGGDGYDLLNGGSGADRLDGGAGIDTASYKDATSGVAVSLAAGRGYSCDAAGDVLLSIENLDGSGYGDWLSGNEAANSLNGNAGNDELLGQGGADTLAGGSGIDHLTGGSGADVFRFDAVGSGHADIITDFAVGVDQIQLDTRFFSGLPAPVAPEVGWSGAVVGSLKSSAFGLGAGATTWAQRVIYNGSTGELFYDHDGSGGLAQVKIAQLSSGLALSYTSFSTYTFL